MFVEYFFTLDPYTCELLRDLEPPFGYNGFGEFLFYRTYSRNINGNQEDWADCVIRVISGMMSIRKDWYIRNHIPWDERRWQKAATKAAIAMFKMQWLPPGRGLWAMGTDFIYERGAMALYNCFAGYTEFYVNGRLGKLKDFVDKEIEVINHKGERKLATVKSFGIQKLQRVVFKPVQIGDNEPFGKTKIRLKYDVTPDHRWILSDGGETTYIRPGHKVKVAAGTYSNINNDSQEYINGFAHGITFGDGAQQTAYPERYNLRLCKDRYLLSRLRQCSWYRTDCEPPSYDGDPVITFVNYEINLKQLPVIEENNLDYLRGFFDGWFTADGHHGENGRYHLDTSNREAAEWAIKIAPLLGYIPTGHSINNKPTNYGKRTYPLNRLTFVKESVTFKVEAIIDLGQEEEVFCVIEPETHSFTLAGGIPTGNCAYTDLTDDLGDDLAWAMDSLMLGVGVGFGVIRNETMKLRNPRGSYSFVIPDTREGWVESYKALYDAYRYGSSRPIFDDSQVRRAGEPIKGFGGVASGPEPLRILHQQLEEAIERYMTDSYYDSVMFKTDLINQIGCCVVAGNVRRSAELGSMSLSDPVFKDLKDYNKYPYRAPWGWMSNNSVDLLHDEDFERLGEIAQRIVIRGEPGYKNLRNFPKGRIGKNDGLRRDRAKGINPCGEIPLEHREVCNVDETLPTVCKTPEVWYNGCRYATLYSSTVSLLPTHQPSTNRVVARNRRVGVSIVDFTGWIEQEGVSKVTKYLRKGYRIVRTENRRLNAEAGVPEAIRVTTVKPGGTVPKLAGKTSGMMYPNFHETLRRVRVARNHPAHRLLVEAGIPYEADYVSAKTDVFEFPILQGPAKAAEDASVWQQAMNLVLLQREWADNAVSNTLNFRPKWQLIRFISTFYGSEDPAQEAMFHLAKLFDFRDDYDNVVERLIRGEEEIIHRNIRVTVGYDTHHEPSDVRIFQYDNKHEEDVLEAVLSAIAPLTKSVALLPHSAKGAYPQMPEEGIPRKEYEQRLSRIAKIDWSKLSGSDGMDQKFCDGEKCEI